MARHPEWFERLDAIQEVLGRTELELLGRKEMKAIFGCSERDSIRLLHKFGAEERGNALSLPRSSLRVQLEAIRSGSCFGAFLRQRQGVARHLMEAREESAARQFRVTVGSAQEPRVGGFQDLPETVTLQRPVRDEMGRFAIRYADGADLMRQLASFLARAGANREEFFAATEPSDATSC